MAGSKPGERRGGRQRGTPNKATAELRTAAQVYTEEALAVLAGVMRAGLSEQARIQAATALLDRGHGRPAQALSFAGEAPASIEVAFIERRIVDTPGLTETG